MFLFYLDRDLAMKVKAIHVYANAYKLMEISLDGFGIDNSTFNPKVPLLFSEEELADAWVRLRPKGSSTFHVQFSEQTPRRFFHANEVTDSLRLGD
jgi:hypothetical protein